MLITEKFERVFYRLCAISVGLSLFYLILFWSNGTPRYGSETLNYGPLFLNTIYYTAIPICLWWGIGQLTGERQGSFIAWGIQSLVAGYLYYSTFTDPNSSYENSLSAYWFNAVGLLIAVSVFAFFHFKERRKAVSFLLIAFLVLLGFNMPTFDYSEFVEKFYRLFGAKNFLSLSISSGTNSTRRLNIFALLLSNLQLPAFLLIVWFLINKIKSTRFLDFKQVSIPEASPMSVLTFSLVHWVTRLTLFVLIFGATRQLQKVANLDFALGPLVLLTAILAALYAVSVIYRNFLVSYFVSRAKYPSWCYLFLNLPFVHVIAWLVAVTMPASKSVDYGNEQMIKEDVSTTFSALKMQFTQNKNAGILTFMLIIIILYTIVTSLNIRSGIGSQKTIIVAMGIVSILLLLWYKSNNRAVYYILLIEAICLFIAMLLGHIKLMTPLIFWGLSNYIIYYSLFHFDHFTLTSKEEETHPTAIPSS
ncbi:hypothetical protein [Lewinella cohaerens]|uniref:hypothetical protein n=1 Tax=Lewinella cohaerens TaxID=70995 RepID=UPI0003710D23|nr:hypothetical protein [Lewinella cohaerens]